MKMPLETTSTSLWVRLVLYLIAHLTRTKTTRPLVPVVQTPMEALERAAAAVETADRASVTARATLDAADSDLDEQVAFFEGELAAHVGRDRKDPLYRRHFPKGLRAITRKRPAEQLRIVLTFEDTARRELPGVEFATIRLAKIAEARQEVERRIPVVQRALDDLALAVAAERDARDRLRGAYHVVFAEIVKLFPTRRAKINSFFRDPRGARKPVEVAEPDTTPTPVPAASAA